MRRAEYASMRIAEFRHAAGKLPTELFVWSCLRTAEAERRGSRHATPTSPRQEHAPPSLQRATRHSQPYAARSTVLLCRSPGIARPQTLVG